MGNTCEATGCESTKHNNCIRGVALCSCNFNNDCTDCNGSGIKTIPSNCGYCATHCNANERQTVDLIQVQQFARSFQKKIDQNMHARSDEKTTEKAAQPMEEKELQQTLQQIESNLAPKIERNESDIHARKELYTLAKKIYKQQESPVFVNKNIHQKLRNNPSEYESGNALPFTVSMERAFESFDAEKFKQDFSRKMNIPLSAITIVSFIAGSVVCHLEITAFEKGGTKYTLGAIAEKFTEKEATKRLVEFGIFLAEFGEPIDQFKPLKQKLIMNPKWNKVYEPGQTYWVGTLNNRKAEPYYCPRGWVKYTTKAADSDADFGRKYSTWPVAYHGTKFSLSMMISFSRLRAGGNPNVAKASGADCFGTGVYFSPSIEYAAHPLYAHPKKMSKDAQQFAGKWVQVVLNCRIKPGCYTKHRGTIGDMSMQMDPNYDNSELEWLIHAPQGTYLDESKVVLCGYMIRTSDCDPRELVSSKWWKLDQYGQNLIQQWYED